MRKILALVVVLSVVLSTSAFAYGDVETHWAKDEITKWSEMEILKGADNSFRPNDPITRGEMAVVLDRVMGYELKSDNTFADLGEAFYTSAMRGANASGIILGSDNKIRPQDAITRQEATVMLCRALGINTAITTSDIKFTDNGDIAPWALSSVYAMANGGYINGNPDGTFSPKGNITRGEVVKILDSSVKSLQNKAGTVTTSVNGNMVVSTSDVVLKDMTIKGDLILAEGIKSGDVTLTNVTVTGKTIVRGGGVNSIIIDGKSSLGIIVVERVAGPVAVKVGSDAAAVAIEVKSSGVKVTAPKTKVIVAKDVTGTVVNGQNVAGGATITGGIMTDDGDDDNDTSVTPPPVADPAVVQFRETYKEVLDLTVYNIQKENKKEVEAGLAAYNKLSSAQQTQLASEKHLLDSLLAFLIMQEQEVPDVDNPAVGGDSEYIPSDEV